MNGQAVAYGVPWLAALACSSAIVLLIRLMRSADAVAAPPHALPWALALPWRPAAVLGVVIAALLPQRVCRSTARRLAAADLEFVTAGRWFALRLLHAAVLAAATAALSIAAGVAASWPTAMAGATGFAGGGLWLHRLQMRRRVQVSRQLPAYLDLLVVAVEAGASLTAAMRMLVARAPAGPLRSYFERVLREFRSGRSRATAFTSVAQVYDLPQLTSLASALTHGEASGMSLGGILRAQASQRTAERFAAAERLAMQAPVKLLGPLILCIFPCTFVVLAVPILVRLREAFAA